jgi:hypothetical protein
MAKKTKYSRMARNAARLPARLRAAAVSKSNGRKLRAYREAHLGTFGAASSVRRIDPATGLVIVDSETSPLGSRVLPGSKCNAGGEVV